MSQHRHKRQNRSRASVSVSFGASGFNPGSQQFTVGGSGAPGDDYYGQNAPPAQAPANASIAFPGAYPFGSVGGGFIAPGNSVDGGHPTRPVIANRRTRYGGGGDRSLGMGHPSRHSIAMDLPPHVSNGGPPHLSGRPGDSIGGPHRPPPLALPSRFTNGVGPGPSSPLTPQRPGTPQAVMLPYNDRSWTIDSATRQTLSHFPHSSLSLPLTTSPLPRHTPHSSVNFAAGPSGLGIATAPPGHPGRRAVTHASMLSQPHGRVPSIVQRTGPPPKAILGGPGGKTFDELRVAPIASRSASTEPSPAASARSMSPLSSPAKPNFADQEVKYLGTTVRVALPPESYSPPDSPPRDQQDVDEETAVKVVRKETYPWPPGLVHGGPEDIPLPPSPTEEELTGVDNDMVSPVPIDHTPHGSLSAPIWEGKQVLVSVPSTAWEPLKPPSPEQDEISTTTYETAADSTPAETAYEFRSKAASEVAEPADHGVPNGHGHTAHNSLSAQTVTLSNGDDSSVPSASRHGFGSLSTDRFLKRSLGDFDDNPGTSQRSPPSSPQARPTLLASPAQPEHERPKPTLRPTAPVFSFLRPTTAAFVPSSFKPLAPPANSDALDAQDGPEPFISPASKFLTTSPESQADELQDDSDLINLQPTPHVPHNSLPTGQPHFYPTVPSPAFMARVLATPRRLKPGAAVFIPRDQPSGPSTPQSQVGLLSHTKNDSDPPSFFKFGDHSGAPSIPSIAGSPFTFTMPASTAATPLPAQPLSIVEQPHTASTVKSASITSLPGGSGTESGGALGLFTFTHKLRPQAAEFKPKTPALGSPSKPPGLQLGLSTPGPAAFMPLSTRVRPSTLPLPANTPARTPYVPLGSAFGFPGTPAAINSGLTEDSADVSRPNLEDIIQPRRPIPILSPQLQPIIPWRNAVSPPTEAGSVVESHLSEDNRSVEEERDTPRSRIHTAKRSSQNSHQPRSWAEAARSQPSSPIKVPTSTVLIHPSLPLISQHSVTGSSRQTPSRKQTLVISGSPRMPGSGESFSPIMALPSEHEHETNVPSAALRKSMERRQSAPAPATSLNADPKPFSFGSRTYTPPPHPPPKQLDSPQRFFDQLRHSTPKHNRLSPIPAPKLLLDGEDCQKFREWVFPSKRRHSGDDRGDERELPDIQDSPKRTPAVADASLWPTWAQGGTPRPALAQPSPDPFAPRQVGPSDSPQRLLPPTILPPFLPSPQTLPLSVTNGVFGSTVDNPIHDVVSLLKTIEDQMTLVKLDTDQLIMLSNRGANESFHRSNGAQEAVHAIKAHLPSPQAIDNVTGMLEAQNGILQDIVRRIEEETTPSPTQFETSDHTQEMFRAIISGQHAMMAKFSELTDTQNAIEDLRGATDALLEAQADSREAKIDHRRGSQLVDLHTQIREEVAKTHRAERDAAILSTRVDELTKHAKEKELEDAWRALIRADVAAVTASLSKLARTHDKTHGDVAEMRDQLTQAQSVIEALRTERDSISELAAERHTQIVGLQKEAAVFDQKLFDLLGGLGQAVSRNRDEKVSELEQEVKGLRTELHDVSNVKSDLRVQLAEALGNVQLEKEKAQRFADSEAGERRTLDLQLKAEKARTSFLESRIQKLEAQLQDTNHNLDVWRSAALEQRLHAERTSAHVTALQNENYHWREFALSADRDRLDQWLATKPFHGIAPQHTGGSPKTVRAGTPVMSPKTVSSKTVQLPRTPGRSALALTSATPPPVRRAIPTIVEPTGE